MRRSAGWEAGLLLTLAVCTFLIVPIVLSLAAGVSVNFATGPRAGLTFANVVNVWREYHGTIFLSLFIALCALVVTTILGIPCAYALVKSQSRWARILEEAITLPLAIPGLALQPGGPTR